VKLKGLVIVTLVKSKTLNGSHRPVPVNLRILTEGSEAAETGKRRDSSLPLEEICSMNCNIKHEVWYKKFPIHGLQ
jgi:hypothetical protein